ncbi:MAG: PepSY-associated TM helix domain-containing protein [Thermonemataceae bacterium]
MAKINRKFILKVHEVLGITTGMVVFIVAVTGCLWVFKEEIESTYTQYKTVVPQDKPFLLPSEVKRIAENTLPDRAIHGVVYGQPDQAVEVIFYEAIPVFYQSIFLNPYTGKVLKTVDHTADFFGFVLAGHVRLWLPSQIGTPLVSYSVLLFLTILVTGLVLWWPKNKKALKQRLQFIWKRNTGWKRKNFDLHTIIGFYVSSFALILAFTGCVMALNWFYFIVYKGTGCNIAPQFIIPSSTQVQPSSATPSYDTLLLGLYEAYPAAVSFELHYPANDSSSIYVEVTNSAGLYYNADYLFYDQYTLEEMATPSIYGKYKDAHFADKVIRMNYDIHVGAIGGITGKIIAFLASLLTATLPISGYLLWYGRRKKKKYKASIV